MNTYTWTQPQYHAKRALSIVATSDAERTLANQICNIEFYPNLFNADNMGQC